MVGEHRERSIAVKVPEAGCRYVKDPSFNKHKLSCVVIKSSIFLHRELLLSQPQVILWPLKSPHIINGVGS